MNSFNKKFNHLLRSTRKDTQIVEGKFTDFLKKAGSTAGRFIQGATGVSFDTSAYADFNKLETSARNFENIINNFEKTLELITKLAVNLQNLKVRAQKSPSDPDIQADIQEITKTIGNYIVPVSGQQRECYQQIEAVRQYIIAVHKRPIGDFLPAKFKDAEDRLLNTYERIEKTIAYIKQTVPTATAPSPPSPTGPSHPVLGPAATPTATALPDYATLANKPKAITTGKLRTRTRAGARTRRP